MMDRLKAWWEGVYRQRWMLGTSLVSTGVLFSQHADQIMVWLLKVAMLTTLAALGYYIDRAMFPYARPGDLDGADRRVATLRRAAVVGSAMLAGALAI